MWGKRGGEGGGGATGRGGQRNFSLFYVSEYSVSVKTKQKLLLILPSLRTGVEPPPLYGLVRKKFFFNAFPQFSKMSPFC